MSRGCKIKCSSIGIILVLIGCGTTLGFEYGSLNQNPSFKPMGKFMEFFDKMFQTHLQTHRLPWPRIIQSVNQNQDINHWGIYQRPVQQPDYERHFYNFEGQTNNLCSDEGSDYSSLDFSCQEPSTSHNDPCDEVDSEFVADPTVDCNDYEYSIRWKGTPPEQANIEIEEVILKGGQSQCNTGGGKTDERNENEITTESTPNFNGLTKIEVHNCFPQDPQGRSHEVNGSQSKTTGDEYLLLVIKKDHILGNSRKLNNTSIDTIIGSTLQTTNRSNNATADDTLKSPDESSSKSPSVDDANPFMNNSTTTPISQPAINPTKISVSSTENPSSTLTKTLNDDIVSQSMDGPTKVSLSSNPTFQGSIIPESNNQIPTVSPTNYLKTSTTTADLAKKDSQSTVAPSGLRPIVNHTTPFAPNTVEADDSQSVDPPDNNNTDHVAIMYPQTPEKGSGANFIEKNPEATKIVNDLSPVVGNQNPISSDISGSIPTVGKTYPTTVHGTKIDPLSRTETIVNDLSPNVARPLAFGSSNLSESMPTVSKTKPTVEDTIPVFAAKADPESRTIVNDMPTTVAKPQSTIYGSNRLNDSTPNMVQITSPPIFTVNNDLQSAVLGSESINDKLRAVNKSPGDLKSTGSNYKPLLTANGKTDIQNNGNMQSTDLTPIKNAVPEKEIFATINGKPIVKVSLTNPTNSQTIAYNFKPSKETEPSIKESTENIKPTLPQATKEQSEIIYDKPIKSNFAVTTSKEIPTNVKPTLTGEDNSQSTFLSSSPTLSVDGTRSNNSNASVDSVAAVADSQSQDSIPNFLANSRPKLFSATNPSLDSWPHSEFKVSETSSSTENPKIGTTSSDAAATTPTNLQIGPISEHSLHHIGHTIKGLQDLINKLMSTVSSPVTSNVALSTNGNQNPMNIPNTTVSNPHSVKHPQGSETKPTGNDSKATNKITIPKQIPIADEIQRDFDSTPIVSAKNPGLRVDDLIMVTSAPSIQPAASSQSEESNSHLNSMKDNGRSTATVMNTTPTVSLSPPQTYRSKPVISTIPTRRDDQPAVRKDPPSSVAIINSETTELNWKPDSTVNRTTISSNDPTIIDDGTLLSLTTVNYNNKSDGKKSPSMPITNERTSSRLPDAAVIDSILSDKGTALNGDPPAKDLSNNAKGVRDDMPTATAGGSSRLPDATVNDSIVSDKGTTLNGDPPSKDLSNNAKGVRDNMPTATAGASSRLPDATVNDSIVSDKGTTLNGDPPSKDLSNNAKGIRDDMSTATAGASSRLPDAAVNDSIVSDKGTILNGDPPAKDLSNNVKGVRDDMPTTTAGGSSRLPDATVNDSIVSGKGKTLNGDPPSKDLSNNAKGVRDNMPTATAGASSRLPDATVNDSIVSDYGRSLMKNPLAKDLIDNAKKVRDKVGTTTEAYNSRSPDSTVSENKASDNGRSLMKNPPAKDLNGNTFYYANGVTDDLPTSTGGASLGSPDATVNNSIVNDSRVPFEKGSTDSAFHSADGVRDEVPTTTKVYSSRSPHSPVIENKANENGRTWTENPSKKYLMDNAKEVRDIPTTTGRASSQLPDATVIDSILSDNGRSLNEDPPAKDLSDNAKRVRDDMPKTTAGGSSRLPDATVNDSIVSDKGTTLNGDPLAKDLTDNAKKIRDKVGTTTEAYNSRSPDSTVSENKASDKGRSLMKNPPAKDLMDNAKGVRDDMPKTTAGASSRLPDATVNDIIGSDMGTTLNGDPPSKHLIDNAKDAKGDKDEVLTTAEASYSPSHDLRTPKLHPAHTAINSSGLQPAVKTSDTESPVDFQNNSQSPVKDSVDIISSRPVDPRLLVTVESNDNSNPLAFTESSYDASSFTSTTVLVPTSTTRTKKLPSIGKSIHRFYSFISWMRGKKNADNTTESDATRLAEPAFDPFEEITESSSSFPMIDKDILPEKLANWFLGFRSAENDDSLDTSSVDEPQSSEVLNTSSEFSDLYHSFLEAAIYNINNVSSIVNASEPIGTPSNWWSSFKEAQDAYMRQNDTIKESSTTDVVAASSKSSTTMDRGIMDGAIHKVNDAFPIVNESVSTSRHDRWLPNLRGYTNMLKKHPTENGSSSTMNTEASSPSADINYSIVGAVHTIEDDSSKVGSMEQSKEHTSSFSKFSDFGKKGQNNSTSIVNGTQTVDVAAVGSIHNRTETVGPTSLWPLPADIRKEQTASTSNVNGTKQKSDMTSDGKPVNTTGKPRKYSHFYGSDFEVWSGEHE